MIFYGRSVQRELRKSLGYSLGRGTKCVQFQKLQRNPSIYSNVKKRTGNIYIYIYRKISGEKTFSEKVRKQLVHSQGSHTVILTAGLRHLPL